VPLRRGEIQLTESSAAMVTVSAPNRRTSHRQTPPLLRRTLRSVLTDAAMLEMNLSR
jgi:hypothetical protein